MRVYQAERIVRRRWPRVLGFTLVVLLAVAATALGGLRLWVDRAVSKITTPGTPGQVAAVGGLNPDAVLKGKPFIALLIGEDCRPGETVCQSDTMMLVRVDPPKKAITTLSFSRDLLVDIPGHGTGMLNSALPLGNEKLVIDTLHELTGITPNYLIPVNFNGFVKLVDTFGGVWLDVDRRYYHVNDGSSANYSEINLTPGYHHLNGRQALAFARYRHTDADEVRLARQQAFLREFKKRVDASAAAKNIFDIVDIAEKNIKILAARGKAPDTDTLVNWAKLLQAIPRENIQTISLQVEPAPNDANRRVTRPEWVSAAVAQFLSPDTTMGERVTDQQLGKATAKTTTPATTGGATTAASTTTTGATTATPSPVVKPLFNRSTLPIEVRNGAGTTGVATATAQQLATKGWKNVVKTADADHTYFHTTVLYAPGARSKAAAQSLAKLFGPTTVVQALDAEKSTALGSIEPVQGDVVAVVGQDYSGQLLQSEDGQQVIPDKAKADVTVDAARDVTEWADAKRKSHLALMRPTRFAAGYVTGDPIESSFDKFYVYHEDGHVGVHVSYHGPNTGYGSEQTYGVDAIQWKGKPPLFDGATASRTIGGRQALLIFNGGKLHRVAWRIPGNGWMWVSNSLTDELSNDQMIAIASTFKPVKA